MENLHRFSLYKFIVVILAVMEGGINPQKCTERRLEIINHGILL